MIIILLILYVKRSESERKRVAESISDQIEALYEAVEADPNKLLLLKRAEARLFDTIDPKRRKK